MGQTRARRTPVLLVDDDRAFLASLSALLEDEGGYETVAAGSGDAAIDQLERRGDVRVVLSDLAMPGMDGIELLREVRERFGELPFIVMTAHGAVDTAVEAMRAGAFQYVCKPVDPDELLLLVERAVRSGEDAARLRLLEERVAGADVLVGSGSAMQALRATIAGLAAVDSTVLIRGETGTGKELVARLIHASSDRASRSFVPVNCTSIPAGLLESELFGHERGAFTGATTSRRGRLEEADGGTVLLDEVGDMPLDLQPKLLRFLQDRVIRRVGGSRERAVDVRVMAATHRDLEEAMADGAFREDLYYRLDTVPVHVPPLRARTEDLPELCDFLAARIARRLGRRPVPASAEALAQLRSHPFPGNVRELENLLERATVLRLATGGDDPLGPDELRPETRQRPSQRHEVPLEGGFEALARIHDAAESELIRRALSTWPALSNREIAERLGTNRRVLELRMRKHGLSKAGEESPQPRSP